MSLAVDEASCTPLLGFLISPWISILLHSETAFLSVLDLISTSAVSIRHCISAARLFSIREAVQTFHAELLMALTTVFFSFFGFLVPVLTGQPITQSRNAVQMAAILMSCPSRNLRPGIHYV